MEHQRVRVGDRGLWISHARFLRVPTHLVLGATSLTINGRPSDASNSAPNRFVRAFEQRIARIDVDGSDDRVVTADAAGFARRGHELIEQLADAAQAGGTRPAFQPGEVVGFERDGNRLLAIRYVYTISPDYSLVKMYSRRRERRRHRPGSTRREQTQSSARSVPDLRRRQRRGDDLPGRRQPGVVVQPCGGDAVDRGRQRRRRGAGRGAGAAWLAPARALGHRRAAGPRHPGRRRRGRVLYVSNFAWIALNNVIAASAMSRVAGAACRCGRIANAVGRRARRAAPRSSSGADRRPWRAPIGSPCR